jgi:CRISPR-associated protein Cas1
MQVFKGEDKITIPINDIDILIINNPQILISQSLLIELSINNKLVILCDNKHLPQCNVIPISGNYNSLKIIQKQIQWTDEFKNSN